MAAWAATTTNLPAPPGRPTTRTRLLKRIATAVVLIPIVLLLVLRGPIPVLAMITALVALLGVQEFLKLTERYSVYPFTKVTLSYTAVYFLLLALSPAHEAGLLSATTFSYTTAFAVVLAPFVLLAAGMSRHDLSTALPAAATSFCGFVYAALPLALLVQLRQQPSGAILVVYLMLVVWAGDIFAYFAGRAVGRHKMAPRISPGKTWEGAVASVFASLLIGTWFLRHATDVSTFLLRYDLIKVRDGMFGLQQPALVPTLILTLVLNVAAQLGDLVESLIKRGASVKDSGSLLPGHGGILDRIDALLFAAPVLWYYAAWRVLQ